jgi:hypothetical protein
MWHEFSLHKKNGGAWYRFIPYNSRQVPFCFLDSQKRRLVTVVVFTCILLTKIGMNGSAAMRYRYYNNVYYFTESNWVAPARWQHVSVP